MTDHIVVSIRPDNYNQFLNIVGPYLPETYDAWLIDHADEINAAVAFDRIIDIVEVKPDEFTAFCQAHRTRPTVSGLRECAEEKRHYQLA